MEIEAVLTVLMLNFLRLKRPCCGEGEGATLIFVVFFHEGGVDCKVPDHPYFGTICDDATGSTKEAAFEINFGTGFCNCGLDKKLTYSRDSDDPCKDGT